MEQEKAIENDAYVNCHIRHSLQVIFAFTVNFFMKCVYIAFKNHKVQESYVSSLMLSQ